MKFKWDKMYLYWGLTAFFVVVGSISFFWILSQWQGFMGVFSVIARAMSPFVYGLLIAYLLDKIMFFFESRLFTRLCTRMMPKKKIKARKSARIMAITLTQLLTWSLVAGMLTMALPQIYKSIEALVNKMPDYANTVIKWVQQLLENNPSLEEATVNLVDNFSEFITNWFSEQIMPRINEILSNVTTGVFSVVKELFNIVMGIVISIYIMYNKETFRAQSKKLLYSLFKPRRANRIMDEVADINRTFGSFISGKIIDSIIVGLINYIFMIILGMPYAALISLIVMVTNLIPVFGPFIGAVPSSLLLLMENPLQCLIYIIFTIVLQQIDGNILVPKILGNATGLSGFWVMFSILFFGDMFGFMGMLFGVPIFAVIYSFIRRLNMKYLKKRNLPFETPVYKRISYIDPATNEPIYKPPEEADQVPGEDGAGEKAKNSRSIRDWLNRKK